MKGYSRVLLCVLLVLSVSFLSLVQSEDTQLNAMTALLNVTTGLTGDVMDNIRVVDTDDPLTVAQASMHSMGT